MYNIRFEQLKQDKLDELFGLLETHLDALGIDFYLIGAIARDVWLTALHDIEPNRITKDLDLAVLVADEDQYQELRQGLLATGRFTASQSNSYTLYFEDTRPVDLLPFGAMAMEGAVRVQGTGLTTIRVDGFQEVYDAGTASITISRRTFQVCTLAGIVVLKLIAYDDRPELRGKDVVDIGQILRYYFDIAEIELADTLYELHGDLFDAPDFTQEKAAARLMGRQMQPIVNRSEGLRQRIDTILEEQIKLGEKSPFATLWVRDPNYGSTEARKHTWRITIADAIDLLQQLHFGLRDQINPG